MEHNPTLKQLLQQDSRESSCPIPVDVARDRPHVLSLPVSEFHDLRSNLAACPQGTHMIRRNPGRKDFGIVGSCCMCSEHEGGWGLMLNR